MSISDTLRNAVAESGLSDNALAKELGLSQPTITRFRQGNDIKFSVADRMAVYFGLQLAPVTGKAGKVAKPAKKPKGK